MTLSLPVDPTNVSDDEELGAGASPRPGSGRLRVWTLKLHNYLGLYLLLFLWLFSASGLVLNHSKWPAARFWDARQEATAERSIRPPAANGDIATATELMRQLGIVGEIGETKRHPDGARFEFQVVKPGHVYRVEARLDSVRARVTEIQLNAWGVLDALHKFTGVKIDQPAQTRDWVLTRIWSLAMDALALGLVVLVVSGVCLWYRRPKTRRVGLVVLVAGAACCAFFLYGLGVRLA